jgi:hypothetical protein
LLWRSIGRDRSFHPLGTGDHQVRLERNKTDTTSGRDLLFVIVFYAYFHCEEILLAVFIGESLIGV